MIEGTKQMPVNRRLASGKRRVASGKRRVASGKRRVASAKRRVASAKRRVASGKRRDRKRSIRGGFDTRKVISAQELLELASMNVYTRFSIYDAKGKYIGYVEKGPLLAAAKEAAAKNSDMVTVRLLMHYGSYDTLTLDLSKGYSIDAM